ncbi:MAG: hypothetical protein P8Z35_18815 [Ignavibacteriaceae bacterium]
MESNTKFKTRTIILASILLIGILALTYGYYKSSTVIIYGSLIIIFPVSLMLPLQNVLFKRTTKRKFTIDK